MQDFPILNPDLSTLNFAMAECAMGEVC